ncbi:hypothetical protein JL721_6607 [Aureococcus anophagefferens]|nr:hypothetical protein JL721_6607 [Aureococcus anophagefferens]
MVGSVECSPLCAAFLACGAYYVLFGALHELAHLGAALLLGCRGCLTRRNVVDACCRRSVAIDAPAGWRRCAIRHAAWVASLALALCAGPGWRTARRAAAAATALEAFASDALGRCRAAERSAHPDRFFCGNFGIILLDDCWRRSSKTLARAKDILEQMVTVTMMRGAQSGGVVTYVKGRTPGEVRGVRSRVVNAKRTSLDALVRAKLDRDERFANGLDGVRFYAGHTRFATTSKATFDGTHPHQWARPVTRQVVDGFDAGKLAQAAPRRVETFICHNGDLEFFDVGDRTYDLGAIQAWLERATGDPMPAAVDSAAVAGLIDLHRCQGCWYLAVRYAFLFGPDRDGLDYEVPAAAAFAAVARGFESAFAEALRDDPDPRARTSPRARAALAADAANRLDAAGVDFFEQDSGGPSKKVQGAIALARAALAELERGKRAATVAGVARVAVDAFFDNDLLYSVRLFMQRAKGSFGLAVTSALDARRQLVIAARGQTMSVACYPKAGLVLYGSEQAAVKAALGVRRPEGGWKDGSRSSDLSDLDDYPGKVHHGDLAVRLDLDDLGGEVCLLDWGGPGTRPTTSGGNDGVQTHYLAAGRVSYTLVQESLRHHTLKRRLVPLERNPLILPLPRVAKEPVAADLADVPRVLQNIRDEWNDGQLNRLAAWTLGKKLRARLEKRASGDLPSHGVDVLVTGCEVSLWLAEQFAADLSLCLTRLNVKAISSNKILGLLGQDFPAPQTGHAFAEGGWDLRDAIVIIVSHSGGTFGPLAVANLMQASTTDIFVVTSEWDTQIGKQVRLINTGALDARVFTTNVGLRPAEPCSVSVVATHQLLTHILMYACQAVLGSPNLRQIAGVAIGLTEASLAELERSNRESGPAPGLSWLPLVVDAFIYIWLNEIMTAALRVAQGRALYHRVGGRTVVFGDVPWVAQAAEAFLSKCFACTYAMTSLNVHSANPADHLVHRFTHRVARRGTLLAVGRPDGRLSALTTAEASVCLSVNQASSIQSLGITCESVTVGHNPTKLPLTANAIFIPRSRPNYLCEELLKEALVQRGEAEGHCDDCACCHRAFHMPPMSAGQLLGEYISLRTQNERGAGDSRRDPTSTEAIVDDILHHCSDDPKVRRRKALREVFDSIDVDGGGTLDLEEFTQAYRKLLFDDLTDRQIALVFRDTDVDGSGEVDFEEFVEAMDASSLERLVKLQMKNDDKQAGS